MIPHVANLIANCAKQIETCLKLQVKKSHIDYKEFVETQNNSYLQNQDGDGSNSGHGLNQGSGDRERQQNQVPAAKNVHTKQPSPNMRCPLT